MWTVKKKKSFFPCKTLLFFREREKKKETTADEFFLLLLLVRQQENSFHKHVSGFSLPSSTHVFNPNTNDDLIAPEEEGPQLLPGCNLQQRMLKVSFERNLCLCFIQCLVFIFFQIIFIIDICHHNQIVWVITRKRHRKKFRNGIIIRREKGKTKTRLRNN